jgi:predicted enzyme related to lactoylglutathione lyase
MADQSVRGRFVWHELMTPDASAAHAFYSKAIGWKSQPWEEDPSYVMFAAPRGPIGATVAAGDGTAPHWIPYVGTGDIGETVDLARQKGDSLVKDITSMSTGSKYAVLKDPYGAEFGVYESADDYGQVTPPKPGEHSWHELTTTDYAGAFAFYSELFGWEKMDEHDMGEMGIYLIYGLNGVQLGGMMNFEGPPPAWMSYVRVKDVNQTAKKVKSAGGKIANGPMEVPGGDWIVQLVDPQGAMFAVHATAASMKKPAKKSAAASGNGAERPAEEEEPAPPVEEPQEAPAKKAPAKKSPARKAPAKKSPARKAPAKKAPAKKAPGKKKAVSKKAPAKTKVAAKKKSAKKKSQSRTAPRGAGSKKTAARKGAKRGAKKAGKKAVTKQTRSGGKKKAAKKPRKGK